MRGVVHSYAGRYGTGSSTLRKFWVCLQVRADLFLASCVREVWVGAARQGATLECRMYTDNHSIEHSVHQGQHAEDDGEPLIESNAHGAQECNEQGTAPECVNTANVVGYRLLHIGKVALGARHEQAHAANDGSQDDGSEAQVHACYDESQECCQDDE